MIFKIKFHQFVIKPFALEKLRHFSVSKATSSSQLKQLQGNVTQFSRPAVYKYTKLPEQSRQPLSCALLIDRSF